MRDYQLTDEQFLSLATGGGSADAIDLLIDAQLSRRKVCLLAVAEAYETLPAPLREALALVIRIERTSPAAGRDLLRYPFLEAWFAPLAPMLAGAVLDHEVAVRSGEHLGSLAAATAVSAGIPFEIFLDCAGSDLVLPRLGTATGVGPGPVPVRYDGRTLSIGQALHLQVPYGDPLAGWRPAIHVVEGGHAIEIMDADPLRDRYPVPPSAPLSEAEAIDFARLVAAAWALLAAEQPRHAAAMRRTLRGIVPLHTPAGRQVSASVRSTFGAIGLSRPVDECSAAELLVHEFQHEKLGALLDLVDLCVDGGEARFHAPWRPDPRPAYGLVQGCYAFAGVAGYWRERRLHVAGEGQRHAEFFFAWWREHVKYALSQLLRSGELTAAGDRFFTALSEVVDSWREESPAMAIARNLAKATHITWRLRHHRVALSDLDELSDAWQRESPPPSLSRPELADVNSDSSLAGAEEITESWRTGRAPGITAAEQAIADGKHDEAIRLLSHPGSAREWIALVIALRAAGARAAYERPELFQALYQRLIRRGDPPNPVSLARWLDGDTADRI